MDTTLKQDIYEEFRTVFTGEDGRELTGELVIPDTMPDAESVVDARGTLWLRGKDTAAGSVNLSAAVSVSVLYAPADGGALRSVELELPAELRLDAPGADEDCRTCASVRLCALEARLVNSRKLAVRAEVCAAAQCFRRTETAVAAGLTADGGQAHILMKTAECFRTADVRERTFAVTDEYAVPPGLSAGARIIARRTDICADDVKYVRGKAVFRGRAVSELLFCDDEGTVRAGRYETELSQIMEVDSAAEEAVCTAVPALTGAFFDMPAYGDGAGRVAAELHFTVQCVCRERARLGYMADVYSNRTLLEPEFCETPVVTDVRPVTLRQTVTGRAEPPAEGEVLFVSACVGSVTASDGTVKTSVLIRLATRTPEGSAAVSKCRLSAEFTPSELTAGARLENITVTAADVYGGGPDVRAVLQMDALAVTGGTIRSVGAVTEDAAGFAARPRTPSATLVRVAPGAGLWELARRCGSSVEAIAEANGGRTDGLLIIPKAK